MNTGIEEIKRSYKESGYIKKAGDTLVSFFRVYWLYLKSDPRIIIKNPKLLGPVPFFVTCVVISATLLREFWPDSIFENISGPIESRPLRLITAIIPMPYVTAFLLVSVFLSLPTYFLALFFRGKPRLNRLIRLSCYINGMSFVIVSVFLVVSLSIADFFDPYYVDLQQYKIALSAYTGIIVVISALSIRPGMYALGVKPIKFIAVSILTIAMNLAILSLATTWFGGPDRMRSYLLVTESYLAIMPISTPVMGPTVGNGSIVLIRTGWPPEEAKHGDIVMYETDAFWSLGRIIAIGGQSVEHNYKEFWVDSEKLSSSKESWVAKETNSVGFEYPIIPVPEDWPEYRTMSVSVPYSSVFVASDDRAEWEFDSRNPDGPGPIRNDQIVGKVVFVLFPTSIGNPYSSADVLFERMGF